MTSTSPPRGKGALAAALAAAALLLSACGHTRTTSGGPTGLAGADGDELARCGKRLGTLAITEGDGNAQALASAGLPRSMAPLVRFLVAKTNCFQVVDRGAAFALLEQERRLRAQLGEATPEDTRRMHFADYLLRAEIVFAEQTRSDKGLLGGVFGGVIGGIAGQTSKKEAVVLLSVVDARTSEIVSSVFGRGSSESAGLGSVVLASGVVLFEGGWDDSPQAKTVAAALVDAWNRTLPRLQEAVTPPPTPSR